MKLLSFLLAGFVLATVTGIHEIGGDYWYTVIATSLLAIGLYSSTCGIDLKEGRENIRVIISAVTLGVVTKAILIGVVLAFIFDNYFYFLLGILVAQIDPLSTAGLLQGDRLSRRAKAILASWASFDDPVTVILCLYVPVLLGKLLDTDWKTVVTTSDGIDNYFVALGSNILLAASCFLIWFFARKILSKNFQYLHHFVMVILLVTALLLATWQKWMLGIALIGLFLRPVSDWVTQRATQLALVLAAFMLGTLLINGINVMEGTALGLAAFSAQVIVGFFLTRGLPRNDRWHIAFAQQNGITAIILSLLFESIYPGTVAIIAPAILVVNILHWFVNRKVDSYLRAHV